MDWQNAVLAPGWGWSLLSMVLVVGSLIGLYRQLVLARGESAREQLDSSNREWTSERLTRCKLEVLVAIRSGTDRAIVPDGPASAIANFWDRIGALAHAGHVDPKLLHSFIGGACPVWWVALAPFVHKLRVLNEDATEYREFEWLAGTMSEMERRVGTSVFDEALLARQLDRRIAYLQDVLRFEQALRSPAVTPSTH